MDLKISAEIANELGAFRAIEFLEWLETKFLSARQPEINDYALYIRRQLKMFQSKFPAKSYRFLDEIRRTGGIKQCKTENKEMQEGEGKEESKTDIHERVEAWRDQRNEGEMARALQPAGAEETQRERQLSGQTIVKNQSDFIHFSLCF